MTTAAQARAQLPSEFVRVAEHMSWAYQHGTDSEAHHAAADLERALVALPSSSRHAATTLLEELSEQAVAARRLSQVRAGLPDAVELGRRELDPSSHVRTLELPDGSQVAVVVPTGSDTRSRVQREALLSGHCVVCDADLDAGFQVSHASTCPAA